MALGADADEGRSERAPSAAAAANRRRGARVRRGRRPRARDRGRWERRTASSSSNILVRFLRGFSPPSRASSPPPPPRGNAASSASAARFAPIVAEPPRGATAVGCEKRGARARARALEPSSRDARSRVRERERAERNRRARVASEGARGCADPPGVVARCESHSSRRPVGASELAGVVGREMKKIEMSSRLGTRVGFAGRRAAEGKSARVGTLSHTQQSEKKSPKPNVHPVPHKMQTPPLGAPLRYTLSASCRRSLRHLGSSFRSRVVRRGADARARRPCLRARVLSRTSHHGLRKRRSGR